jgi:hypothetical protein
MMKNESDTQAINEDSNIVVYVTQIEIPYEGSIPLGIYSTLEKAQAAARAYVSERGGRIMDDVYVYEVNVDEPILDNEYGEPVWTL